VNDYAGILSRSAASEIEQTLATHERETSNQIVIVTVPTLDDRDIADVAFAIGERWGIGKRRKDNGVLFVIAPSEHRTRIEVGKGLEGALTDLQSHVILDDIVAPAFRRGDFDHGVRDGAQAIMQAVRGEFRDPSSATLPFDSSYWTLGLALLLLVLFLFFPRAGMLLLLMGGRGGRSRFAGGGGRFGGGGASGRW
jgi:uncharacterized protein